MTWKLIPPPELCPPSIKHLSLDEKVKLWAEACDAEEQRVLAELRAKIGPEGDLRAAYREWLREQSDIKERHWIDMLTRLGKLEAAAREEQRCESEQSESVVQ